MKAKNVLMIFAMIAMAVMFTACASITDPDDPSDTPQSISVDVKYIRIEPWYLESPEMVTLNWKYLDTQGSADMPKIAENTHFVSGVRIKTEIRITMGAEDWRKRGKVRKHLIICFTLKEVYRETEFVFNGSEYGEVVFVLHNDGTIEIVSPV
jgi:hypothetical protein